ncbi:MAG: proline dehydrogenase family protein [Chloroflexi bacterium]|nr:proline dehydrogenase family protein [Chloroflexota bacterium]
MQHQQALEARTQELGRQLHARTRRYRPSAAERMQDWLFDQLADDPSLRSRLLRFIDVLAALDADRGGRHVKRLFREYFSGPSPRLAWPLRAALAAGRSGVMPPWLLAGAARWAARATASRFIAGQGEEGIRRALAYLEHQDRFPTFDILGEQVFSRAEADHYRRSYLQLLEQLGRHPWARRRTLGGIPCLQVSIKLSALTHDFNPTDPADTLRRVQGPLEEVLQRAARSGIGVTVDAEEYQYRELAWYIASHVLAPGGPCGATEGVGIVVQAYQRDAEAYAQEVVRFARSRPVPLQVRLVKGAYWDYEIIHATQNGWPAPVFQDKAGTDQCFERVLRVLLEHPDTIRVAVASHNLRSHAYAEALGETLGLVPGVMEHQTLFRTAEGLSRAIRSMGWEERDYVPVGRLLPGMAYLVRRVLENTSQVGFLTQSRIQEDVAALLQPPAPKEPAPAEAAEDKPGLEGFHINPPKRLFLAQERAPFEAALAHVRQQAGREYLLHLGDEQVHTGIIIPSLSPSDPDLQRPLGLVHQARLEEADRAIVLAQEGFRQWSQTPARERARILLRTADLMREGRDELAAWVVHEGGRNWSNALGDVDEAIDHIDYNARNLVTQEAWLEVKFQPRGVVAAIPPWNFPAALPMGMTSAALAAGNAVILKSAGPTPIIAQKLVDRFHQAGVPRNALIHLPGPGSSLGQYLVEHPGVAMVAFTGSKDVGKDIYQRASRVRLTDGVKKVIAELGGKNAIIVFPDADIDEAVRGILLSTFEHANQKCSACSRVFAHRSIYARLRDRLREAALDLPVGLAHDPGTVVNPLINMAAKERILAQARRAREEGEVLVDRTQQDGICPLLVGPMVVELQLAQLACSHIAKEEIFGPILTLTPYDREEDMVREVNATVYAQTAGIFSRSPHTITRMVEQVQAGGIYINRVTTGARVGIEPFGGFQLSGTGPKTGGAEYLLGFVTRRLPHDPGEGTVLPSGTPVIPDMAVQVKPWQGTTATQRRSCIEASLRLLGEERRPELLAAIGQGGGLSTAEVEEQAREAVAFGARLLEATPEIGEAQQTITIPGQQTFVAWRTPRGIGYVATRPSTAPALFLGMALGPLLAGNGLVLAPDERQRALAELLRRCLLDSGVPLESVYVAPSGGTAAAIVLADQLFHFAVTDLDMGATQDVYARLGVTREEEGQAWLKALISMDHDLRPGEPGFLRQFALPKTVAIQTLRHGTDLQLV